jgi:hypothetical protein
LVTKAAAKAEHAETDKQVKGNVRRDKRHWMSKHRERKRLKGEGM